MKKSIKLISLVLALGMVFTLCGCKQKDVIHYSDGIAENGYLEGIKALDLFDITDMDKIVIDDCFLEEEIEELITEIYPNETVVNEGTVEKDSYVNIDYVGKIDGVEFEGGSTKGNGTKVRIANGGFIEGFLEQIVGHKVGEVFDIKVTFPDPYENNNDLAGKEATFTITINNLISTTKAEWNDAFVEKNLFYMYYSLYGVSIKTTEDFIAFEKDSAAEAYIIEHCKLKEGVTISDDVQKIVNNQTILTLTDYAERREGVELRTYLSKNYGVNTAEEYLEKYKDSLASRAKNLLLVQALAEYFDIEITDDEVKEYFNDEDDNTISFDEAVEHYGLPYIKETLLQDKVLDFIFDSIEYVCL